MGTVCDNTLYVEATTRNELRQFMELAKDCAFFPFAECRDADAENWQDAIGSDDTDILLNWVTNHDPESATVFDALAQKLPSLIMELKWFNDERHESGWSSWSGGARHRSFEMREVHYPCTSCGTTTACVATTDDDNTIWYVCYACLLHPREGSLWVDVDLSVTCDDTDVLDTIATQLALTQTVAGVVAQSPTDYTLSALLDEQGRDWWHGGHDREAALKWLPGGSTAPQPLAVTRGENTVTVSYRGIAGTIPLTWKQFSEAYPTATFQGIERHAQNVRNIGDYLTLDPVLLRNGDILE